MRVIIKMLRVPNLLIIALTFCILRYLLFIPVLHSFLLSPGMTDLQFMIMVTATIIIAAAGYITNDYFDVMTDRVNKPEKQYIGNLVTPGSALVSALLLSCIAAALATWLSVNLKTVFPVTLLLIALAVTWWYAIQLKKSFLWGNIAVASLSAGTIAMAWLIEKHVSQVSGAPSGIITRIIVAISIFAFLLSLLREIVKDIEDMDGDRLINCKSLPIIKGISFTKTTLFSFTAITLLLLLIVQICLLRFSGFIAIAWLFLCVEIPLICFTVSLAKAQSKADFHKLSSLLKWIMVGGISAVIAGQF
jgi:4-hydroxybenzoate polyprenyltransferase